MLAGFPRRAAFAATTSSLFARQARSSPSLSCNTATKRTMSSDSVALLLGDKFPDFEAETTAGPIKLHDYLGSSWGLLCSHPADFTPVCTTELGTCAKLNVEGGEFPKRDVKMLAISCDPLESHQGWIGDIKAHTGHEVNFPLIADADRSIAASLGMLHPDHMSAEGLPMTVRTVYVISPEKILKLALTYPASTGRNFDEIIRAIDSLQLTATRSLATPADWQKGGSCMVLPTVSPEDAAEKFPEHKTMEVPSGKGYLRVTPTS
ncbi:unnamed protein product [Ectocarpus sp. CCAP 1310/34]|nr:unnamed protein product [Ectocarpus sp. CCAP 1310/34]